MLKIVEVGPRDGLQNETVQVPTDAKIAFVEALSKTGLQEIEVSAFVSPAWVPQLGDAEAVFAGIARTRGVVYSALVPNEIGLERALASGIDKASVFTSASETFNRKNINTSIDGAIDRYRPVIQRAQKAGLPVRGYLSTAFWCAYEGRIAPPVVVDAANRLMDAGVAEVSISDTIGKASPDEVKALLDVLLRHIPSHRIAMHFHDTFGRGTENVLASWSYGIRIFDASAGGLGGCPYSPGATGNVATETVVRAFEARGIETGIHIEKLSAARTHIEPFLGEDPSPEPPKPEEALLACKNCGYAKDEICCHCN